MNQVGIDNEFILERANSLVAIVDSNGQFFKNVEDLREGASKLFVQLHLILFPNSSTNLDLVVSPTSYNENCINIDFILFSLKRKFGKNVQTKNLRNATGDYILNHSTIYFLGEIINLFWEAVCLELITLRRRVECLTAEMDKRESDKVASKSNPNILRPYIVGRTNIILPKLKLSSRPTSANHIRVSSGKVRPQELDHPNHHMIPYNDHDHQLAQRPLTGKATGRRKKGWRVCVYDQDGRKCLVKPRPLNRSKGMQGGAMAKEVNADTASLASGEFVDNTTENQRDNFVDEAEDVNLV